MCIQGTVNDPMLFIEFITTLKINLKCVAVGPRPILGPHIVDLDVNYFFFWIRVQMRWEDRRAYFESFLFWGVSYDIGLSKMEGFLCWRASPGWDLIKGEIELQWIEGWVRGQLEKFGLQSKAHSFTGQLALTNHSLNPMINREKSNLF